MDICGYLLDGYLWLFVGWISVAICWMDICGYLLDGYLWLFVGWISVVIGSTFIPLRETIKMLGFFASTKPTNNQSKILIFNKGH
jgi:hypothetical protein